jgi:ribonuclease P protein component
MSGSPGRATFPRSRRLLRHSDFEVVYKGGKRQFAAHLTVFYFVRRDSEGARVGFTVGKFLGCAVERNRVRRRLREAVRAHYGQLASGLDVVVHAKQSALNASLVELASEISHAFQAIAKTLEPKPR